MKGLIEPIHTSLTSQLNLLMTGDFDTVSDFDARPEICKFVSMMLELDAQDFLTFFLKGLANSLFLDSGLQGLVEIRRIVREEPEDIELAKELLSKVWESKLSDDDRVSLSQSGLLLFAHASRVSRALKLYEKWI